MFHIKSDKRSQTSARLISDGLFRCIKHKSFSDITISDLQRESGVGRATFYRLFDRTVDILAYECDGVFSELVQQGFLMGTSNHYEMFRTFFKEWTNHLPLLITIMQSGHIEILYQTFRNHAESIGMIMIPDKTLSSENVDYMISILTSALMGTMSVWLDNNQNKTPDELAAIFMQSIVTIKESF